MMQRYVPQRKKKRAEREDDCSISSPRKNSDLVTSSYGSGEHEAEHLLATRYSRQRSPFPTRCRRANSK